MKKFAGFVLGAYVVWSIVQWSIPIESRRIIYAVIGTIAVTLVAFLALVAVIDDER